MTLLFENEQPFFAALIPQLQALGVGVDRSIKKNYQIQESDVTNAKIQKMNILEIQDMIAIYENAISEDLTLVNIQTLLSLYSQAIEYYSAIDDPRHEQFLHRQM
jgi:hypothetical protein